MTAAAPESFWDWSLAAWSRAAVERHCLALQDEHGVFVPALLFACWCARFDLCFSADAVQGLRLADWDRSVIRPVRSARRALREIDGARSAACARLRRCELALEKHLMSRLEALAEPAPRNSADRGERLQRNLENLRITLAATDRAYLVRLLAG